ncbi:Cupin 2 conserved barrel domain protein [Burkholderia sp. lig30]|jgi:gentisate 1,2-dioxygenase|uniref:cupin domain-containing protein n=1 Tax=Burkholderia sp. lig30 TaxID=1192124 RepID=UPI000460B7ED|nr:cupin domain-containing protein [Burkholderia sp. lig30]KDB10193.1 Cupin 2 conserved barrel domain protein [Burkholderia sp. lig30]
MQPIEGDILPFSEYLELTSKPIANPVIWRWQAIESETGTRPHNQQGTLALSGGNVDEHGTVAPDLSLVIQVLRSGETTERHRHSFWHLYIARSGSGELAFGEDGVTEHIESGDTLFVPAWCYHTISNRSGSEPFVLYRLQNLPQNASAGNLMREIGGKLQIIYADAGLATHR